MKRVFVSFFAASLLFGFSAYGQGIVYSNQKIGSNTVVTSGGATFISGPNGIVIIDNSADTFSGSWSTGMNVTLSRVLSGEHLPSKLVIKSFEVKMNDGEKLSVLAVTAQENDLPRNERAQIVWGRAAQICALTKTHPFTISVQTTAKWFKGLLLDLSKGQSKDGPYTAHQVESLFSGARYFSEIICGTKPRGY